MNVKEFWINDNHLIVGKDPIETAAMLARELSTYLATISKERDHVYLALSGGQTPKVLYELLASERFLVAIPWTQLHIFFVDERWVPHDHPDSNYRMVRETLLSRVPIPETQVHPMPVTMEPPEQAKARYERELKDTFNLPSISSSSPPIFDLILLGMGEDGHVASIFPGTVANTLLKSSSWVECPFVPQLDARRMTLTPLVLNAAEQAWFFVTGKKKAPTLRVVIQGAQDVLTFPAQLVRPRGKPPRWYVDVAASSHLLINDNE